VRDAVATLRTNNQQPRILGLVVEVPLRRRVFVPITRVTSIESGAVVITGLLNMRRFDTRPGEVLVLGEMLDRSITLVETSEEVVVEDMGMEQNRNGDWLIAKVHIMRKGRGLRRKGATSTVTWEEVIGFANTEQNQGVTNLLSTLANLRAADLAAVLQDLAPKRRIEVASALEDDRAHLKMTAWQMFWKKWMKTIVSPFLQSSKVNAQLMFWVRWIQMMLPTCCAKLEKNVQTLF